MLPELLGYGETDKPTELEAFALRPMAAQIAAILEAEGVEKVVALGHDFGAFLISLNGGHEERNLGCRILTCS